MNDTASIGLPGAARQLGVSVRVLRRAIRTGRLAAPEQLSATSTLPSDWVQSAKAAIEASPQTLGSATPQKVPPFARYRGTSAWRKYSTRVKEYAEYRANQAK